MYQISNFKHVLQYDGQLAEFKNTHDSGDSDREHSDKIVRLKEILKQLKTIVLVRLSSVDQVSQTRKITIDNRST